MLTLSVFVAQIVAMAAAGILIDAVGYLENYIGVTKSEFSIIGGAVMVGSALVAIPFGILVPRGTIIRKDRQISIVSAEELALIAKELHVPEVKP